MATVDVKPFTKAFFKTYEGQQLLSIIIAFYKDKLTSGFARDTGRMQGSWRRLNKRYLMTKVKDGYSTRVWQRTGYTLNKQLSGNAPTKIGTKKGVRFGVDKRNLTAYIFPKLNVAGNATSKQKEGAFILNNKKRPILEWKSWDTPIIEQNVKKALEKIFVQLGING